MGQPGMPSGFWIELLIILLIIILLVGIIPAIFRYRMGAKKRKWFSYNQVNKLHKKVDLTLRIVFVIFFITFAILFNIHPFSTYIMIGLFVLTQIGVQAYMEWRFSDNRKDFQVSLIQLTLAFVTLLGFAFWLE
ncbi:DUF4181 domain-containing protein [Sporosarcina siberiensis]|uniref:DUF4181 domain-containing protein n=1 Tax=Sporosarcina siberiensis TaxID=1365606 RepID=A0ABW4SIT1_9BACL